VDAHGRRTAPCREYAEYWCIEHELGFTAPNRGGIHGGTTLLTIDVTVP
jgi:hypothetical protein